MHLRAWTRVALLAALTALLAAAPAEAVVQIGTLSASPSTLRIGADAAPDAINLSVDRQTTPAVYVISSAQTIIRGNTYCSVSVVVGSRHVTRCPVGSLTLISVSLGGGADSWIDERQPEPFLSTDPVTLSAGPDNDSVSGTRVARDTFSGDDGDDSLNGNGGQGDTLSGGAGNDSLNDGDREEDTLGFPSPDTLEGGIGNDDFFIHLGGDTVRGDDGGDEISEFDAPRTNFHPAQDFISGGTGPDVYALLRDRGVTLKDEGPLARIFSDTLEEQVLTGVEGFRLGRGADVINAASLTGTFSPFYDGRGGPDEIVGSDRNDVIFGGGGSDRMFGRGGDDTFDAKDGEPVAAPDEEVDCGAGTNDQASIDLLDAEPVGCELVARSAIGEGPHVRIGRVRHVRGRTFAVRLRCPRRLGHRCRGRLEIALSSRGLRAARGRRYSIRAGRRATVRVRLTRGAARRLGRRRSRRGYVRSTERGDVTGRKTTLARRRLRRP